jgi:hypothetical protein
LRMHLGRRQAPDNVTLVVFEVQAGQAGLTPAGSVARGSVPRRGSGALGCRFPTGLVTARRRIRGAGQPTRAEWALILACAADMASPRPVAAAEEDTEDMSRERAETYLRGLAEAEFRRAASQPWDSAPRADSTVRVKRVAEVLTFVGTLDDGVADQILDDFELALDARQTGQTASVRGWFSQRAAGRARPARRVSVPPAAASQLDGRVPDHGDTGWPGRWHGPLRNLPVVPRRSGGQCPGAGPPGQAFAGQVAQVHRGGPVLEPGVVLGFSPVAQLEPAAAERGDLGDGPLDVGPVFHVVLPQPGPVAAGGAQQVIVFVHDEVAADLAGGAAGAQRAAAACGSEGDVAAGGDAPGYPAGAGDGAVFLADGEVVQGEPALDRGSQRPGA